MSARMCRKGIISLAHEIDQTRSTCSDLAPSQDASVGLSDALASRKRKRASSISGVFAESFVIRPHPSSVPNTPQTLKPILILPRSYLPLSYLDPVAGSTAIPTARLFSAYIRPLESEILDGDIGKDPVILIARIENDRSLYATEWVSKGIYALCKLGSWVKEKVLLEAALCSRDELQPAIMSQGTEINDSTWWRFARVNLPLPSVFESQSKQVGTEGDSGVLLSMKHRKPSAPLEPPHHQECLESGSRGGQSTRSAMVQSPEPMECTVAVGQSAQQIFDMIRAQYLETLYISRASLAYFPKGLLSRARAFFSTDPITPMPQTDLITFLGSLVLSLSLVDKKYKTSIPEFVGSLLALNFSEGDADTLVAKGGKKRRKKKMKPGKDGLYPGEGDYLRKWWMDGDSDLSMAASGESESNAKQIKRRVANLRTRETELQIILILEILALQESPRSIEHRGDRTRSNAETAAREEKGERANRYSRKDPSPSLALVLDILVDRLCIWQSVSSEDGAAALGMDDLSNSKALDHSNRNTGSASAKALEAKSNSDHLRDFYNEVIMPFYGARLPEHCNTVSRKLGGPTSSLSIRPPLAKVTSSSKASSRPGDAVKRTAPSRPRQTLERVLTDEKKARSVSRGPSMPPVPTRSATAPAVPGLKLETSECSLWSVPTKDSQPPMNVCRGGVLKSKRFSQREIDMSFTTIATNAKLQRRARVEEELKEAITALKKPNRGLAIKEYIETSDHRVLTGSGLRRTKKPVRNTLEVQVMATPKGNRKKNIIGMTPSVYQSRSKLLEQQKLVLGPNEQYAPHQMLQGEQLSVSRSIEQPIRQTILPVVQDTPSRVRPKEETHTLYRNAESTVKPTDSLPQSSFTYQTSEDSHLEFKDLEYSRRNESKKPATETTMEIRRGSPIGMGSNAWVEAGVQETPLKSVEGNARAMIDVGVQETPIKGRKKGRVDEALSTERDASIYEALGWDEVDDLV